MRAALLSLGESINRLDSVDGYDITIGVNSIVDRFACDWWSAMDVTMVWESAPLNSPALFTVQGTLETLLRRGMKLGAVVTHEAHGGGPMGRNAGESWSTYSAPAGLWLAGILGATHVDCWGCDMQGTANYDGTTPKHAIRTDERWERERAIWNETAARLRDRGIEVQRCGLT